ncbi:MAG: Ig-like domain-containing protein, partial [Candidatus Coproplasma sp.]
PAEGEATTSIPYTITEATAVTGITLNRYTLSLIYDSETPATAQLTATIAPSGATNKTVIWTTSDSDVATVSSTGLVTATGAGTATITAKSDANNEITNSCTVTVTASSSATAVTGVTLDSKTLALYVNSSIADADKATLTATITPEGATNKDVTWTSSDPTVATVDTSGNVTALSIGNTNITVTTSDGGYTAVCSVMVYDASTLVSVTSVSLDKTTLSLTVGDSDKLTASITPSNATITSVSWSSSDDTVATVSSTGVVTAKKAGTATITVTTLDGGKTATCAVNVSAAASTEEYTVTFNMNGHGTEIASVETVDGKISAPTEPTAVGYTFGGWYTDAACSGTAIDFDSYTFVENTTIYAKWTVMDYTTGTHTLTFSADADIFTSNVVNSGNGYNKTYFKVANNDYLYAIMRLQSGSVIKVTGKAQPSNKSVNESDASKNTTTLGISLSSDSSGAVGSDLPKSYTFTVQNYIDNGNSALSFAFECTVTTEGIIVFAFTRDSGGTGCEITELVIEIDPASAAATPYSIAYASGTTTFKKGITASTSDWSFTVTYSDSTSKTVTASNVSIGTIDTSADGSVSVSYTENGTTVYTTVNYTVQAPTAIAFKSGTQTFAQNVVASTSDWKFTVTYGSLGTEEVDVSAVTVGTIDTTTTGENKSVTVTLTGTELTCTVTYAVTAAATCVADGIYTFSSEYSTTNKNAGFTISGTYTSSANVTYNGTTYNDGLKMESSTSVKFTLGSAKTVRFVVGPEGNKIKIDGTSYTIDSGNTITIENLTAGEHEITKDSSSTYLVLIIIGYEAVPVSSVTISGDNVVVAGRSITLTATVLPINAENKTVTWAIKSGSEYAEINSSTGVLTGKAIGDVVVTATADGVTSADFGVTVNAAELDKLEYTGTTSYTVSSEAVTPDWVFTATYSDGTTKTVTPTLTGDISDGTISIATAGDYTVTASYTDENETIVTCTVNYKVIEESSGTINDSFYAKDASGYSSGKALNLTSTNKYFTITSTNNYKLAVVTNVDSDSCLVATSNKRNFTVTCGSTATKIVITLKLAFATGAKFETISTATITGTTETFEITNIVDEYTFTITQGNSITITATDYIAFVSAIAAVTPAS